MKKIIKFVLTLIVSSFLFSFTSCGDKKKTNYSYEPAKKIETSSESLNSTKKAVEESKKALDAVSELSTTVNNSDLKKATEASKKALDAATAVSGSVDADTAKQIEAANKALDALGSFGF